MIPPDASAAQLERHAELLRRLTEPQRAALVTGLWHTGRALAQAGVRHRHPAASAALHRWLLTSTLYDDATAERLHGPRPTE